MTSADCTLFETKIFPQLFEDIPPVDGYCCSRPSVKCNPENRITSISIGKNALVNGILPPQLAQLDQLTILQLFQNNLKGSIPPALGSLTQLTDLSLGGNRLTGTIPPELGNLVNLTFLYVNINNLQGIIPAELGKLTKLKALHLNDNPLLVGPIPASLKTLPLIRTYDDKNAPINSTATTTPPANNLNSNPLFWLLISALIIIVILVVGSFLFYRRFSQNFTYCKIQLQEIPLGLIWKPRDNLQLSLMRVPMQDREPITIHYLLMKFYQRIDNATHL
ncbi:hypothetical protein BC833DRAFT_76568 [Globomyces pollinis-pini]|nr:hypothetical protein BC833DRAFT_76568 [Globomyces pollinis-pini]